MVCGKRTMRWKRAMQIARRGYYHLSLKRRKRVAATITRRKKRKRR